MHIFPFSAFDTVARATGRASDL